LLHFQAARERGKISFIKHIAGTREGGGFLKDAKCINKAEYTDKAADIGTLIFGPGYGFT
jgi:hypothetical protein